ncbi:MULTISPECIES: NfeD family protein [Rhizobium/Agrobacterium group]|jgi:membrane protein implicated in regulation of membrane protease activity|uniref:NfeD family protein n=1 Tax=Agrobacterium tumefaciens TaxID=358 RepID=A0AAJ4N6B1_AGRTU|nr:MULTISPECIES: NfeD family protein [Rhizobium/Agrobacterium group]MDP9563947.1 membrane protein implicated in regulation of membrane protease activity [Rhizobium nepotum]AYM13183.1 membrane protein [Agrobacterium tumefaciens]MBO9110772.1 NfeD family protein [Agrobacterium sp. S2/73]MDH7807863.1 membrane protein implicated in regulation of membrane protease activity [Rhizobium sp. AN67]MDP9758196.1 membrane protein implicated in regulation of membrane protease activity [Agrobacterium tumefaci
MLQRLATELGPWSWWIAGFILLAAELVAPGVFLIWIGIAALVIGALSLLFWDAAFWAWQLQLVLFAALSIAFALLGRKYFGKNREASDEPFLNQREASLVGRTATLQEPVVEGRGRIRLDDTWWSVNGEDMPAGTRVRIAAARGRTLTIEPLDRS